ncbi:MAG: hypothetical protein PVTTEEND_000793, partial [Candidatus Fervidibacter sp.]
MGFAHHGTLVVANSHSNKKKRADAPSDLQLERLSAATTAMRRWQYPLQRTAIMQGVIFRTPSMPQKNLAGRV